MSSSVHDSIISGLNYSCQPSRTNLSSEGSRMSSFNDPRFVHNVAKLVGNEVEVVTTNGDHLRGILDTFSDEFAVALKSVQEFVPNDPSESSSVPYIRNEVPSHTVIVEKDYLVSLTADEVKQDCEKKPFLDAGISALLNGTYNKNGNASVFIDRDFVPWEAEYSASSLEVSLEEGGAGWDSEFMLESFEKSNPGKTSYKGMEQYTNVEVPQNLNEEEVKEIENFVESCSRTSDDYHEDESDDRPEEEKFAAVIREEESKPTSGETKRSPSISRCSVDSQASQRSVKYRTSTHSRQWVNSSGATNMLQNRSSDYQWGSTRRGSRPFQRFAGSRRGRNRGTTKRNSPPTSHQHSVKYNVSGEQGLNYYSDRDFKSSYNGRPSLPLTSTRSPPNRGVRSSPSSDTTRISRASSRRGSPVEKPSRYCGRPSLPASVSGNKEPYDSSRRSNHKQMAYRHSRGSYDSQKGSDRKPVYKMRRSQSRDTENWNEGANVASKKSDKAEESSENTTILVSSPQSEISSKFSTQSRSVTPETSSDLAAKVAHSNLNPLACVFIPHGSTSISEVNSPSPSRPDSISTPQVGAVIPQIITGQQNYFTTPAAQIASPAAVNLVRAPGSKKAIVSVHTPVIENPIPSIHPAAYTPSFQHPAAFPNMRYVLISEPVQQEQETPGTTPQYPQGSSSGTPTPVPQLVMFGNQPYPVQYSDMIGQPYNPQGPYYIVNPNSAPPYPQIVPCQLAPLNTYPAQHIPPSVAHSLALQQPQFYHPHVFATAPPQTPFIVSSSSANTNSVTVQVPPLSQPPVHPQTTS